MAIFIIPQSKTLPAGIPDQVVVLDCVKNESFGSEVSLSEHPVEPDTANIIKYGSLVDHAIETPRSESIEAVVSDDPNQLLVGEIATRLFVALGTRTSEPLSKMVMDRLQLFAKNAVMVDVQSVKVDFFGNVTVLSEYRDRLITSVKTTRSTRQGLDISLSFREVQFAYSSTGEAQKAKTEKAQRQQQKPKDKGKTAKKDPEPEKSWWKSLTGG